MTPKQALLEAIPATSAVTLVDLEYEAEKTLSNLADAGWAVVPAAVLQNATDAMHSHSKELMRVIGPEQNHTADHGQIAAAQDTTIRETVKTPDGPQVMVSDGKPKQDKEPA